jgi:hypothetical protein
VVLLTKKSLKMGHLFLVNAIVFIVFVLSMAWAEWLRKNRTVQPDITKLSHFRKKTKTGTFLYCIDGGKAQNKTVINDSWLEWDEEA